MNAQEDRCLAKEREVVTLKERMVPRYSALSEDGFLATARWDCSTSGVRVAVAACRNDIGRTVGWSPCQLVQLAGARASRWSPCQLALLKVQLSGRKRLPEYLVVVDVGVGPPRCAGRERGVLEQSSNSYVVRHVRLPLGLAPWGNEPLQRWVGLKKQIWRLRADTAAPAPSPAAVAAEGVDAKVKKRVCRIADRT